MLIGVLDRCRLLSHSVRSRSHSSSIVFVGSISNWDDATFEFDDETWSAPCLRIRGTYYFEVGPCPSLREALVFESYTEQI